MWTSYAVEVRAEFEFEFDFCGVEIGVGVSTELEREPQAGRQAGTKEECVELGTTVRVRCVVVARGRTLT